MTADDEFTRHSKDDIERSVVQEEREMFSQFVQNLSGVQSQAVQPLPFRRVLSPNESSELWSRLRERWGISGGYWYPLAHEARQDIEASQDEPFHDAVPAEILRTILEEQGVRRVWELRESEPHYEEELDWFDPCYNGAEGYWSSAEMDWIIDASHESSVTVGGWMLERIKARWPSWHENRWTSLSF
jgi:hypothetical protein